MSSYHKEYTINDEFRRVEATEPNDVAGRIRDTGVNLLSCLYVGLPRTV